MHIDMSEFNWTLILMIVAISATVSFVGDRLGMKIGKKRISLFGLRPRYTSTVITLFTGVGVAILTLVVAASTSTSVRDAFFGVNYLEREITRLMTDQRERSDQLQDMEVEIAFYRSQLNRAEETLKAASDDLLSAVSKVAETEQEAAKLEAEHARLTSQIARLNVQRTEAEQAISKLRAETEQLKTGLTQMKEGQVVAFQGEMLSQTSIRPHPGRAGVDNALTRMVQAAEETLNLRDGGSQNHTVVISGDARVKLVDSLATTSSRKLLRLTVVSNIVRGQPVEAKVNVYDSKLVYAKGTELMTASADASLAPEDAADQLYTMLKQINRIAVDAGVLPDPISGVVGNLDSIEFYEMVDRISEAENAQTLIFTAGSDIYTEGPVEVDIEVSVADKAAKGVK